MVCDHCLRWFHAWSWHTIVVDNLVSHGVYKVFKKYDHIKLDKSSSDVYNLYEWKNERDTNLKTQNSAVLFGQTLASGKVVQPS